MFTAIKRVLVGLTEDRAGEPATALRYGLSLAALTQAHVTVRTASAQLTSTHDLTCEAIGGPIAHAQELIRERAIVMCARAKLEAALAGVTCDASVPQVAYDDLVCQFVTQARVHDVTVVDAARHLLTPERGLIEELLLHSGRPTIVVPGSHERFALKRVLVAWDGSGTAARAIADAMPFLRSAVEVEVLAVWTDAGSGDAWMSDDIARWLSSHDVPVTVREQARAGSIGDTVLSRASEFAADLIVMGGYEHPRAREWILGGTTQQMLGECATPLLISH